MNKNAILAALAAAVLLGACARSAPKPAARKVLYYRSPMDPKVTSPVPAKDSMGMDFVPVYADQTPAPAEPGAFRVSPDRLQLIGVKTGTAERRDLVREIRTVGRVAYDPELYRTEEEYLAALAAAKSSRGGSLLASSRLRLTLLGLSGAQIEALARAGRPDRTLLLSPGKGGEVWLYADAFESDLPLLKAGQAVVATSPSLPGRVYRGVVASIDPTLNPRTRAVRLRVRLKDPDGDLRPDMYLDAAIRADLGTRLAVPRDAVVDSGIRQVVFLDRGEGHLVARRVTLGVSAGDWVEVRRGVEEGDRVVTSGNFLIDSESQLRGAEASFGDAGGGE
ncbi:MAG: efflux RND transporter periplasmic adaptor subunit [Elusimicrobia bacterium]|nr:efflux RND transporter periplasmic adaptor subunit [Elusimicrobiota bacterium]